MSTIEQIKDIDFLSWIIIGFLLLSIVIACHKIICDFLAIIKKPIGIDRQRKEDHELLLKTVEDLKLLHDKHEEDTKQSIRPDAIIRDDLKKLTETVDDISNKLSVMQSKIDVTEMAKLKEKLLGYYRKYKDVGEWQRFESDVFWGLYESYISHGGNSFVKDEIEPVMRSLKVID